MRTLLLKHDYEAATTELKGKHPAPSHVDQTINRDTVVIAPDLSIIAVLLKDVIAPKLLEQAFESWSTVYELPSNRATAVGTVSLPRIRSDGTLSERREVSEMVLDVLEEQGVRQGVLGYLDATPDQPCHKTPLTIKRPELLDRNENLIKLVDGLYAQNLPTFHARQFFEVEKAPHWRLWDTAFTTVYIIKELRCAYHTDSGNFHGVMSAIIALGKFTGGELVLPRWRFAIDLKPGDVLLFDPQELHGNLPFEGTRLSAIFYCESRIAECGREGRL